MALSSPRDQGRRQAEGVASQCDVLQTGALRLISGLPMTHSEIQKFPQVLAWPWRCWVINSTDFRTPAVCDTCDPRRPGRSIYSPWSPGPWSRAVNIQKPHPLTVEPQWVLPRPRTILEEKWGTPQQYLAIKGEWVIQKIPKSMTGNLT